MLSECFIMGVFMMSDALRYGGNFRTLSIINDYNREALLIELSFSLPENKNIVLLNKLIQILVYNVSYYYDWIARSKHICNV